VLTLPEDDEPIRSDSTPELEPDPFASIFERPTNRQRFPGTVFPKD